MQKYIGTKVIEATPAIRKGGKVYLSSEAVPKTMDPVEEGYKVRYEDGYESWSPKDVFEKAYYEKTGAGLPFGIALEHVKQGKGMRLPKWSSDVVVRTHQLEDTAKLMSEVISYYDALVNGLEPDEMKSKEAIEEVLKLGYGEMTHPYLYVESRFGRVPWKETMIEILSNDWIVVD